MFLIPRFTTFHDFYRELPNGNIEYIPTKELITEPKETKLIITKAFCWLGIELVLTTKILDVKYAKK